MRSTPATVVVVVLVAAWLAAAPAGADTGTALGDRGGEGSTPFTGLAQAPEANLFTGALHTAIPIEVPPGRRSMTPQLALQYSSSRGPGPFGFGWDVPIGRIERSTTWGAPRCTGPHTDDFALVLPTGASELVREAPGSNYYRPAVEQAYVRAEKFQSQNYWVVYDRSGLKYTFGDVDSARLGNSAPLAFLSQAADGTCRLTTAWALTRIEDPNGNTIDATWSKVFNVLYPATVRYGGSALPGGPQHAYTVRFLPEWRPATDRLISHRNGVPARLVWRIYAIDVETDAPAPGTPVRRYALQYRDDAPGAPADGYQSILSAVTTSGLPTQHLAYTPSVTGHRTSLAMIAKPAGAYAELRVANDSLEVSQTALDMNGDGVLDLVRSDDPPASAWSVYWGYVAGDGTPGFQPTPTLWQAPGNWQHLRNVEVSSGSCDNNGWSCTVNDTFDISGDGIPDHIDASNADAWVVYKGRGVPQWGFAPGVSWPAPHRRYIRRSYAGDTYQDVVDVNGDGLSDLVVSGAPGQSPPYEWDVYLNTGSGFEATRLPAFPARGEHHRRPVARRRAAGADRLQRRRAARHRRQLGEVVDARCQPVALAQASCLEVYFNTGQGFDAAATLIPVPPSNVLQNTIAASSTDRQVVQDLFDVNGDGLPDWIYRRYSYQLRNFESEWRVLLNLGGTLEPLAYVPSTALPPPYTDGIPARVWAGGQDVFRRTIGNNTRTDLIDVNGDGFLDQVTAGGATWTARLHDARERPNLLGLMENGLGGTNTIVYRPSTAYDNSGGDAQPDLPFITWVVDKTRQNDAQCTPPPGADVFAPGPPPARNPCIDSGHELVATFRYQDGRFDALAREFRGFRRVVRTSVEGSANQGNQTDTYFGQDPATTGRILQVNTWAGSAALVRAELNFWGTRSVGGNRTQLWLAANRRLQWDLPTSGAAQYVETVSDPPDPYGNITHHYSGGLLGAARVDTYTAYATPQAGAFVYDRPSNVRIADASGVLEEKWFYYDGQRQRPRPRRGRAGESETNQRPAHRDEPQRTADEDVIRRLRQPGRGDGRQRPDHHDGVRRVGTLPVERDQSGRPHHRHGGRLPLGAADQRDRSEPRRDALRLRQRRTPYLRGAARRHARHLLVDLDLPLRHAARPTVVGRARRAPRCAPSAADHPALLRRARAPALHRPLPRGRWHADDRAQQPRHLRRRWPRADALPSVSRRRRRAGQRVDDVRLPSERLRLHRPVRAALSHRERRQDRAPHRVRRDADAGVRRGNAAHGYGRRPVRPHRDADRVQRRHTLRDDQSHLRWPRPTPHPAPERRAPEHHHLRRPGPQDADDRPGLRHLALRLRRRGQLALAGRPTAGPPRRVLLRRDQPPDAALLVHQRLPEPRGVHGPDRLHRPGSGLVHLRCRAGRQLQGTADGGRRRVGRDPDPRVRPARPPAAADQTIDLPAGSRHARFEFSYDTNDRIVSTTYPDGELVSTEYDDAGQAIALRNQANAFYVTDALYDLFGRPSRIDHVNGVVDTRAYGGPADQHRLVALTAAKGGTAHLDLAYADYTDRGLLALVIDRRNLTGALSNSAAFTYDAVGRLTTFNSTYDSLDSAFAYDAMGNLTRRADRYLRYDNSAKAHQVTSVHVGTPTAPGLFVTHDANGNRTTKGAQRYEYDTSDRLANVVVGDDAIQLVYDFRGQQVAKIVTTPSATTTTRFYGALAETTGGTLTKWYFLGPLRVASQSTSAVAWETAALDRSAVWLAGSSIEHPALIVVLARDARWVAGTALLCVVVGLLVAPWRRRPVVGLAVRPSHAILVALTCAVGTLPWPVAFQPAPAWAGGNGGTVVRHYHLDHLGSTQVVTDKDGNVVEQVRYLPYGAVRGHWNRNNLPIANPGDGNRREFSGYLSEPRSGLQFAGARVYDPDLGSFLTRDPAAQFASPYSYGGGDPLNWIDPNGEEFVTALFIALAVSTIASAAINAIIAAAQGLPLSAIGKAALGGAIAGAVGVGLGVVASAASMGAASLGGTLPAEVTLGKALDALGEVAARSAFSSTIANAAGQVAAAAGAPTEVTTVVAMTAGIFASVGYDQLFLNPSGELAHVEAKGSFRACSTTGDHTNITLAAAADAGFNDNQASAILRANLAEDEGLLNTLNNQSHFDFGTQSSFRSFAHTAQSAISSPAGLNGNALTALGQATHHLQDQFALGHMFPGTSSFKSVWGAVPRFILHNVVGGEVAFRQASYDATRQFLQEMRSLPTPI